MLTTKSHARQLAKALVCTTLLAGCQLDSHRPSTDASGIRIVELSSVQVDTSASAQEGAPGICASWKLDMAKVAQFFTLAREVRSATYHNEYDTAPCEYTGKLTVDGNAWDFRINGAAKGQMSSRGVTRYFGCDAAACAPLVLWPYTGLE